MNFGARLTLFFTITLLVIELITGVAIRKLLRETLIEDGKTQVAMAEARFAGQLTNLEDTLGEGVRLLTLDFALRRSIAGHDKATVVSALNNHGRRIGATRMVIVETDGTISGDTAAANGDSSPFAYPALLDRAAEDGRASTVAVMENRPVWLVVVPVMAPDPIAYIAAVLPLDDAQLLRMRDLAGLPGQLGLAVGGPGNWQRAAGTIDAAAMRDLPSTATSPVIAVSNSDEMIVLTRILAAPSDGTSVLAVIGYPLSEAVRRYQRVLFVLVPALTLGLIASLIGGAMIARGVARPIEALARHTKRIAEGDYTPPPPLRRSDELGQLSSALNDMTRAISEREERIGYQATHDPVTGLANRQAFAAAIDRHRGQASGIMLVVGLVRWRETTSSVGREVGDRLMRDAGARIGARFPARTPIGGIGESSFAVFLAGADHAAAAAAAASLIDAFDAPYKEQEITIDAPVAVGASALPQHGTDAAQLLRRAEVALLTAFTDKSRIAFYRPDADPHRPERLSLMSDLRIGLRRGEFELVYQPKLNLRENTVTGAEALVRWNHPTQGLVRPDSFITLAEETGNIQHLTRWALRAGLTQQAQWHALGLPVRVAINLSVRDLNDDTLPEQVGALLRELQMPAHSLILEVTESAIMGEPEAAIAVLRRLDEQGIDLAIDDFGVGQSSLAYLRRLPVREIKLDKAFILKLAQSPDDQTIVRSVVELGHGLGYRVTAEGVEDAAALGLLRDFGCDYAQGYYIARPLPAAAFPGFATSWQKQGQETGRATP